MVFDPSITVFTVFGGFQSFPMPLSSKQIYLEVFFMHQNLTTAQGAMRATDAAKYLGIALSTFWRWVSQGRLPKGKRLSARCTVWRREDIERFLTEGGEA